MFVASGRAMRTKLNLRELEAFARDAYLMVPGMLGERWLPLKENGSMGYQSIPTEPGDVPFFDSYVPHRSQPNSTSEQRRVLYVTYNAASAGDSRERYYAEKRASFPPDCERDPEQDYKFRV